MHDLLKILSPSYPQHSTFSINTYLLIIHSNRPFQYTYPLIIHHNRPF